MKRNAIILATCLIAGPLLTIAVLHSVSTHAEKTGASNSRVPVERIEADELIPVEQINTSPVERIDANRLIPLEQTKAKPRAVKTQPMIGEHYASVGDYFKAGNPNATTYRLGEPRIKRKSFSLKQRNRIHQANGGVCQVCGSTGPLEVEHMRGIQNGGGNERFNLGSLCLPCHHQKTRMDNSLRRQRDKLLQQRRREEKAKAMAR